MANVNIVTTANNSGDPADVNEINNNFDLIKASLDDFPTGGGNLSSNAVAEANITDGVIGYAKLKAADIVTDLSAEAPNNHLARADAIKTYVDNSTTYEYANFTHQETAGTNGQDVVAGSWQTRTLNTTQTNTITDCTLAANAVTLPAGTYRARAMTMLDSFGDASLIGKIRLRDTTGASTLIMGLSHYKDYGSNETPSINPSLSGQFTIGVESVIELQYQANRGKLGRAISYGVEVYAMLEIEKIPA